MGTVNQIPSDCAEPRREVVGFTEFAELVPSDQKGLLGKVFRFVKVAGRTEQYAADEPLIPPDNLPERCRVAAASLSDEVRNGVGGRFHGCFFDKRIVN